VLFDVIFISIAGLISFLLVYKTNDISYMLKNYSLVVAIMVVSRVIIYFIFHLYSSLWRYASADEFFMIIVAVTVGTLVNIATLRFLNYSFDLTLYSVNWLLNIIFSGGIRFAYRLLRILKYLYYKKDLTIKNVLIYGGGDAGALAIKELRLHPDMGMKPVVILDDDPRKKGSRINGIPVLGGRNHIQDAVEKFAIDEIIIALPSVNKQKIKTIIDLCKDTGCKLKILPGVFELINGKVDVKKLRDVEIDDLLGREPVHLDCQGISEYINNKIVMVTGGGGSIGSELSRQIASFGPKMLIIFDIYENNAYNIQLELMKEYPYLNLEVLIGSVRDKERLSHICMTHRPDVVFHAAAHKHVPLMEDSPGEAIKNNVFGTLNMAEIASQYNVEKFVLISTDKAVNPTNIMGATKRIAEMIIQMMNNRSKTEFVAVRFGNVLGSNGSVIPLFKRQIAEGGPVTVTHPDIIRYFMTIPEACQLVLQASTMAKGGEIFILDMGQPVKILDLAKDLIRLSGLIPGEDIKIKFTGLRPGEKLYEELLTAEESLVATHHEKILISKAVKYNHLKFRTELEKLRSLKIVSNEEMTKIIKEMVPSYHYDDRKDRDLKEKEVMLKVERCRCKEQINYI
jgi:FlaA1/EpsC-like NDP-sugar epimerase